MFANLVAGIRSALRFLGPRPAVKLGVGCLSLFLILPGLALELGGPRYHHPYGPGGAHFLQGAYDLTHSIGLWSFALILAGLLIPLIFSADVWRLGTVGCGLGAVVALFFAISCLGTTPPGWLSASTFGPLFLASLGTGLLSIYEHVPGKHIGHRSDAENGG